MVDIVDQKTRSRMMSGIKGKDTKPEVLLRKALHAAGFRFRLHRKDLPGVPDIVLPKYRAVILINGCFWHGHDCRLFKWPQTRPEFWRKKIEGNMARDQKNLSALKKLGWRVCILWECEQKGATDQHWLKVTHIIVEWLISDSPEIHIPHSYIQSNIAEDRGGLRS